MNILKDAPLILPEHINNRPLRRMKPVFFIEGN